jgi:hypothetical protein
VMPGDSVGDIYVIPMFLKTLSRGRPRKTAQNAQTSGHYFRIEPSETVWLLQGVNNQGSTASSSPSLDTMQVPISPAMPVQPNHAHQV